jgi:hypothetical protein
MAPAYKRKRSGSEYFWRISLRRASETGRRFHLEVVHDVLSGNLGNGQNRSGPGGVSGDKESVTDPVAQPRSPGHHIPVESVADPHGGTPRHQRYGIFRIEEKLNAEPTNGGGYRQLVPCQN